MRLTKITTAFLAAFCLCGTAFANPQGGVVEGGNSVATITNSGTTTTIQQSSPKAIINWGSFDISQGETTHFQQPTGGIALNKVNSGPASQINGTLSATGQIILVNGAGIHFGPTAQVNVGGIIASTIGISDGNFRNGIYRFDQRFNTPGAILNEGHIKAADHGLVALVGDSVTNTGTIEAKFGYVRLIAADEFAVSFKQNGAITDLIYFEFKSTPNSPTKGGINNTGVVLADGGSIHIGVASAKAILDNAINLDGVVQANTVEARDGHIRIYASTPDPSKPSNIKIGGKVSAASADRNSAGNINIVGKNQSITITGEILATGNNGGFITIDGLNIRLDNNAKLDISAYRDGGFTKLTAGEQLYIGPNTQILANSTTEGNGGIIVLLGKHASMWGFAGVRGGTNSGNGGLIYINGTETVESTKNYDLRSYRGRLGRSVMTKSFLPISFPTFSTFQ